MRLASRTALTEQRRIVAKVDALMALDRLEASLATAAILHRLLDARLQEALAPGDDNGSAP